jgi:hypothetical protein
MSHAVHDGPPVDAGAPGARGRRRGLDGRQWAVVAGVAVLAGAAVVAVAVSRGGDDGGAAAAGPPARDVASAMGDALATGTTVPSNRSDVVTEPTTATPPPAAVPTDLPAVTIPAGATPPTTIPGSEPSSVPGGDGDMPLFGHLVVDLTPGGYQDFAVRLRSDQRVQLLSLADDGVRTHIEVYGPDGASVGGWEGGEPGVVNGLEWTRDDPVPATGTYVIRVVHRGGSDEPFALGFFGDP